MMNSKPYTKKKPVETSQLCASYGLPTPTEENLHVRQSQIDEMKIFFATAPHHWDSHKTFKRFHLPNGEAISCVLWDNIFFISGTDIVRSLTFRFHAFGRPVINPKKFEEGVFSDLRNLKPGHDARLEDPKSDLLDMLYKNNCIRTQKKQKVFFWFSVPHDRLFLDALERDLKREKMGLESTTRAIVRPATSLSLDSTQELFEDLKKNFSKVSPLNQVAPKNEPWNTRFENQIKRSRVHSVPTTKMPLMRNRSYYSTPSGSPVEAGFMHKDYLDPISTAVNHLEISNSKVLQSKSLDLKKQKALLGNLSLADGSPSYKQRRRRTLSSTQSSPSASPLHAGRRHDKCHHPPPQKTTFTRVASFGSPPPLKSCKPQSGNSRLAMAAYKADLVKAPQKSFGQCKEMEWQEEIKPEIWHKPEIKEMDWQKEIKQELCCQMPSCQHLFDRLDSERFTCEMCGKLFSKSENLKEHQRMEHANDMMDMPTKKDHDPNDDRDIHSPKNYYLNTFMPQPAYGNTLFTASQPSCNQPQHTQNNYQWGMLDYDLQTNDIFPVFDQPMYHPILSATSSTHSLQHYDDDLSSSAASSPIDTYNTMTLFSPFKPMFQEQEDLESSLSFEDVNQYQSIYASYINPSPFSSDMNFVFGA